MREIPSEEYAKWAAIYNKAAATINGRSEEIDKAAELIERNMMLLGATAIEDKLQDGVPEAIATLQQAGIKVWVLTGDKQETAINIGLSCRLISEAMSLVCQSTNVWSTVTEIYLRSSSTKRMLKIPRSTLLRNCKPSKRSRTLAIWKS